jgi:hypothetical protein
MNYPNLNRATHFSVVWAATLVIVTMLEWSGLDREPLKEQILSPFIERAIVTVPVPQPLGDIPDNSSEASYQREVSFHFKGPLFLACFFGPVLVFHGVVFVLSRFRRT